MKVTIVTVYRGETAETYVGAVLGSVSAEEREAMADAFEVDEDEEDTIGFQEVELAEEPRELAEVLQAFP
jgi:hypothetical protein